MNDLYRRPSRDEIAARLSASDDGPAGAGAPQDEPAAPRESGARAAIRFGGRVAAERRRRGWDAAYTAAQAGISVMSLTRTENGTADVRLTRAAHLAGILGISLDGLLAPCPQCGDAPPPGFTCNACGTDAPAAATSEQDPS